MPPLGVTELKAVKNKARALEQLPSAIDARNAAMPGSFLRAAPVRHPGSARHLGPCRSPARNLEGRREDAALVMM